MLPTEVNNIAITRWDRPVAGNPVSMASNEALQILTPRIGPTSVLFLHRFARRNTITESTTFEQLASELGVSPRHMVKTVERIIRFNFARWADDRCEVLEVATQFGTAPPNRGGTPSPAPQLHLRAA